MPVPPLPILPHARRHGAPARTDRWPRPPPGYRSFVAGGAVAQREETIELRLGHDTVAVDVHIVERDSEVDVALRLAARHFVLVILVERGELLLESRDRALIVGSFVLD